MMGCTMIWKMWKCPSEEYLEKCDFEVTDGHIKHGYEVINATYEGMFCPKCGSFLEPRFYQSGGTFMIKGAPYSKPLHSDALGMQPDQVAEHREKFPNIEIDNQNRPVFENMPQHEAYMEKCGIVKHKQKVKPQGKTIATLKN